MIRTATLLHSVMLLILATSAPQVHAQDDQHDARIAGTWMGTLRPGGIELRVVFNITADSAGRLQATMDSPDQGAMGIPISEVTLEGQQIAMTVPVINGRYDGELGDDGSHIGGRWSQSGSVFPLDLERVDEAPVLARPQEPEPPFPYRAEEVTIPNEDAGIALAGTLTIPEGPGPHPAVVLVSGSGAQDRNEAIAGHKPFLVIADYLTRRGIAVLRHDDRGFGESTGDFQSATTADMATDVVAAVEFLHQRPEIDRDHVGIIGHSEGGLSGPMAALEIPDKVNFLVLLAPPGIPGEELLYVQDSLLNKAMGASDEMIEISRQRMNRLYPVIRAVEDDEARQDSLREVMNSLELTDEERAYFDSTGAKVEEVMNQQIAVMSSDWFRFFLIYDPVPALQQLDIPVLALFGEKDLQVPPEQNLPPLEEALSESDSDDYLVLELPGLNHLFQHADTGHISEYSRIEETFAPEALEVMGDWILERVE